VGVYLCIYDESQTSSAGTSNLLLTRTIINPSTISKFERVFEKETAISSILGSSLLSCWALEFSITPDSLCFREARCRAHDGPNIKVRISEEEWMWHLVMHMCNARHLADSTPDPITLLIDPIGSSVKELALNNDYEPLKGKKTLHLAATSNVDHQRRV
jgi:hypothetical protein